MALRRISVIAAALLGLGAGPLAALPSPERALLAEMKAACGGEAWDRLQGWHERGRAELPGGQVMHYEAWHDIRTLRSVYAQRRGDVFATISGYDGEVIWNAGAGGRVERISDPAALRRRLRDLYVSGFAFFFPDRFPATFALLGTRRHEGTDYDVLRITPANADSVELWVNRQTHRIGRIVAPGETAELGNYREFDGLCTATTGRQGDGDPAHTIVLHVESVETGPLPNELFFAPAPASPPSSPQP
ncbi:MAG TPA: hypothetical protein VEC11_01405 [Allosphingosinicella sp.]|nr:hypothetical protein [Allosphingosinicella sp.]